MAYFWQAQVQFHAEGGAHQRFLSAAATAGIPLWNTSRRGSILSAACLAGHYAALRPLARRHGMRLRVKRRWGLPFLLRPLRGGLIVGAVLAYLLLWYLSGHIWVIRVQGNTTVSAAEILQVLEPLGVKEGSRFSAVDIPTVQLTALQRLPRLSWLTVNPSGSVVTVQVQEKEETVPVEETAPANVVAARDGVIVSLSVTGGRAVAKVGDAVTAGSLLISGVTDSTVGPLLRRAAGTVMARTTVTLTAEIPLTETKEVFTPVLRRRSLYAFGLTVPLYTDSTLPEAYTATTEAHPLVAGGVSLPVGWKETVYTAPQEVTVTRSAEEAAALAAAELKLQEQALLQTAEIEEYTVSQQRFSDKVVLSGTYVCLMDIARTEKIVTN